MQEMQIPSLGGENPLEKKMATHSSIHAWDREAWLATVLGVTKVGHDIVTKQYQHRITISLQEWVYYN